MREKIERLQKALLQLPPAAVETNHYFADGLYARELFIPKGMCIVGKVHKKDHFFMISKGRLSVTMDDRVVELVAPVLVVSQPGVKRAGYALEDTICITFHRTDLKDLAEIEDELVEYDPTSPYLPGNILRLIE
jgi:hypothetical protein